MTATLNEGVEETLEYKHLRLIKGRTRYVYVDSQWVYKVPKPLDADDDDDGGLWTQHNHEEGISANEREADQYQRMLRGEDVYIPVAECYLQSDGSLKMRRVTPKYDWLHGDRYPWSPTDEDADPTDPEWIYSVDCCQVGYDHEGKLVAYDM